MNLSKKQLVMDIVQHIVLDLNALESLDKLKWNIPNSERQANYRSWAEMAMKKLTDATDEGQIYVGYFDGSSKPNPGIMSIGGYIKKLEDMDTILYRFSIGLGEGTNNRAEYLALIELLEIAIKKGIKRINIFGDSKLVVMQVNFQWKAKKLMALQRDQVLQLLENFDHWSLSYVPRELNVEADSLTR